MELRSKWEKIEKDLEETEDLSTLNHISGKNAPVERP